MVRLILIKAYALITKCCGHGAKSYTLWEEFTYVSVGTIKMKILDIEISFQLRVQMTLKSISIIVNNLQSVLFLLC